MSKNPLVLFVAGLSAAIGFTFGFLFLSAVVFLLCATIWAVVVFLLGFVLHFFGVFPVITWALSFKAGAVLAAARIVAKMVVA